MRAGFKPIFITRSEEHTSELQSHEHLVCRLLPERQTKRLRLCLHSDRDLVCYTRLHQHCALVREIATSAAHPRQVALYQKTFTSTISFLMRRRPPRSPLFPSTPPFR